MTCFTQPGYHRHRTRVMCGMLSGRALDSLRIQLRCAFAIGLRSLWIFLPNLKTLSSCVKTHIMPANPEWYQGQIIQALIVTERKMPTLYMLNYHPVYSATPVHPARPTALCTSAPECILSLFRLWVESVQASTDHHHHHLIQGTRCWWVDFGRNQYAPCPVSASIVAREIPSTIHGIPL